jgi:cellulose synthase/poly-beta-1,6-N-acetylglucosamine synthase-like glycosyltransferase
VDVALSETGLEAAAYAAAIERAVGVPVSARSTPDPTRALPIVGTHERPRAAVVIATRDRPESLLRCLESIRRHDHPAAEIVVVDNRSQGRETAELVERLRAEDPRFRYVREERPGLARAHNAALDHVTSPVVAFTDDDVVVDPGWLRHLVDAFGREPAAGCITGMIFPLELETAAQGWLEQSAGFNKGFAFEVFTEAAPRPDPLFPYAAGTFGSGANMAFRTDVLRSMRGFDPALGAGTRAKGGDDLAAFFDVIAAGHAVAYEPGALVYHQHHRTFAALQRQTFGYGAGLTAYLTKTVLDHPARIVDMLARAPRAARHALSPQSAKNERRPSDTPASLVRRERLGMLAGPALYLWSRWDARFDRRPAPLAAVPAARPIVDTPIPDPLVIAR